MYYTSKNKSNRSNNIYMLDEMMYWSVNKEQTASLIRGWARHTSGMCLLCNFRLLWNLQSSLHNFESTRWKNCSWLTYLQTNLKSPTKTSNANGRGSRPPLGKRKRKKRVKYTFSFIYSFKLYSFKVISKCGPIQYIYERYRLAFWKINYRLTTKAT